MRNKKAGMEINEILELILAIGVVAVLIVLSVSLYNMATYDKNAESAKSLLKTLKGEIEKVDDNQVGDFMILNDPSTFLYLIYFGSQREVEVFGKEPEVFEKAKELGATKYIFLVSEKQNQICICYRKGTETPEEKIPCKNCLELDYPALLDVLDGEKGRWIIEQGQSVRIRKENENYLFEKK